MRVSAKGTLICMFAQHGRTALGCKSRTSLDSRNRQPKARVSFVSRNLKEAGGKFSALRTETDYEAAHCGRVCITKRSPITIRALCSIFREHMRRKQSFLTGEVSRTGATLLYLVETRFVVRSQQKPQYLLTHHNREGLNLNYVRYMNVTL